MPDLKDSYRASSSQALRCDQRVRRSRTALTNAFAELALEHGYRNISIKDVAKRADVGRSTLYTHFYGMDDLLAQSLDTHLSTIASCTTKKEIDPALTQVITHFWNQRSTARTMLQGDAGIAIARLLVCRLEEALLKLWSAHPSRPGLPVSLIAEQLGTGQLALLRRWLAGRESASPEEIARSLHKTTYSAALVSL